MKDKNARQTHNLDLFKQLTSENQYFIIDDDTYHLLAQELALAQALGLVLTKSPEVYQRVPSAYPASLR